MINKIRFDSILFPILVLPFILNYRISWLETPYWFFGLIFILLSLNIVADLYITNKIYENIKTLLFWILSFLILGGGFLSAIIVRHQTSPIYLVHDIIIQQESAIRFLIHGTNPYSADYFKTPLVNWHFSDNDTNPALYHFVMEPFYLLFALPFYFLSTRVFGFFDGRIPLFFLLFSLAYTAWKIPKNNKDKIIFSMLILFNPAMLGYNLEGRSDVFMYAFALFSFYLLREKKYLFSSLFLSFAFAIKQSIWPIFPFYFLYLFLKLKMSREFYKTFSVFLLIFLIIVLPFFFWNPKAFWDSTINYLSGSTSHSYPISGYGFSMVLYQAGIIKNVHQHFPFEIFQFIFGAPVFIFTLNFLRKNLKVNAMIISYGIFLSVYWYFSRYFNNSHLAYLSIVFLSAYFFEDKLESQKEVSQ